MKQFTKYTKGRILVTIYANILGFIFIDILGLKYWQFAIWFIPVNFLLGYAINKWAFKDEE